MIQITGMKIEITRGDCEPFTITLTGEDVPADGEAVLFTVKKNANYDEPVIAKELTVDGGKVTVNIRNTDTWQLPFGDYEWDIRFPNLRGEGEPYTPMTPQKFVIAKVIGNV